MKVKIVVPMLFVALMTMGFDCVNNDAQIAINLQGIAATYNISPTSPTFTNQCNTIKSTDYLQARFGTLEGARIYDIQLSTVGDFPSGNASGFITISFPSGGATQTITINYSGTWASLNTPKSILVLASPQGNIGELAKALLAGADVTICGTGGVTPTGAVPSGLSIKVEVFGQFDVKL